MRALWVAVLLVVAQLTTGCALDQTPELLTVTHLSPERAESGDRLELGGSGFARGRKASVRFHGRAHRAGASSVRVDVMVPANSTSDREAFLTVTPEMEAALCGVDDGPPRHATFRGEVTVAFSPKQEGAPPVRGTLHDVVLDVFPVSRSKHDADELRESGLGALSFLGVKRAEPTSYGIRVAELEQDSQLGRAGVHVGDTLATFDSVRVFSEADLQPPPGKRLVDLGLTRTIGTPYTLFVDLDGLRPTVPEPLLYAGWVLGFVGLVLALWFLGGARLFTWAQWRGRLLADESGRKALRKSVYTTRSLRAVRAVLLGLAALFVLQPAFGCWWVSPTADLLGAYVVSSLLVVLGVLVAGGHKRRGWSLLRGLAAPMRALPVLGPGACALAFQVVSAGHADASELVAAQGPWPWQWSLFSSPMQLVAFVLFLFAALPRADVLFGALDSSLEFEGAGRLRPWLAVIASAHAALICAIAAALFLGGWSLPGTPSGPQPSTLGVCLFLLKAVLLMAALELLRRWTLLSTPEHFLPLAVKRLVPGALLLVGLEPLTLLLRAEPLAQWLSHVAQPLTFALAVAFVVLVALWRRRQPLRVGGHAVNPWL